MADRSGRHRRNVGRRASYVGKHSFKILLIGSVNTGKTSLLRRFTDDVFDEDTLVTVGFDFRSKLLNVPMQCQLTHTPTSMSTTSSSSSAHQNQAAGHSTGDDGKPRRARIRNKQPSHSQSQTHQGFKGAYEAIAEMSSSSHLRSSDAPPDHVYGLARVAPASATPAANTQGVGCDADANKSVEGSSSVSTRTSNSTSSPSDRIERTANQKSQQQQQQHVPVRLEVWDTAGQERFKTVTNTYYRKARAVLLCFDVSSRASFADVSQWLNDVRTSAPPSTQCALVAMKTDIPADAWTVPSSEAYAWARARDMLFFEVSAKSGSNVEETFSAVAQHLVEAMASSQDLRLNVPVPNPSSVIADHSIRPTTDPDGDESDATWRLDASNSDESIAKPGWCGVPAPIRRSNSAESVPVANDDAAAKDVPIRRTMSGASRSGSIDEFDETRQPSRGWTQHCLSSSRRSQTSSSVASAGSKQNGGEHEQSDAAFATNATATAATTSNPASPDRRPSLPENARHRGDDTAAPADWPVLGLAQILANSAKEHHQLYTIRRASSTGSVVGGGVEGEDYSTTRGHGRVRSPPFVLLTLFV
jgi:small GTP-binding protein